MQRSFGSYKKTFRATGVFLVGMIISGFCVVNGRNSKMLSPEESVLVGKWYSGNGHGTISIVLDRTGTYKAKANQCLGPSGKGSGTWELKNGSLIIHPRR